MMLLSAKWSYILIMFVFLSVCMVHVSAAAPQNGVSTTTDSQLSDKVSSWSSFAQKGFKIVATSIVDLRQALKVETERVTQLIKDVRSIEKNDREMKESLANNANNMAIVKASLASLEALQPRCPKNWSRRFLKCYRYTQCTKDDQCNWEAAHTACLKHPDGAATLVSVRSLKENTFVSSLAGAKVENIFIGGSDKDVEKKWVWTDGSKATFTNWDVGQPDNAANIQDCMLIWKQRNNKWDDMACNSNYPKTTSGYVCERPAE